MTGRRDARRLVNVEAEVVAVGKLRLAGMNADPNANGSCGERVLCVGGRDHRVRRARERGEDRIVLRSEFDAAVSYERLLERPPVRTEQLGVTRSHLLQQPRRALDVGEEEGDRAGRELAHPDILAPTRFRRGSLVAETSEGRLALVQELVLAAGSPRAIRAPRARATSCWSSWAPPCTRSQANTYAAAVWNDVREGADCPAIDVWRAGVQTATTADE